jgi:PST family polysaccharide transporter
VTPEPGGSQATGPDTAAPHTSLRSTIGKVAGASAIALLLAEFVSFVQTVALARLLTPAQVGIFVAGTVLTTFLGGMVEGGLRAGLIQREGDLADAAETVFRVTLIGGLVATLAALAAAPVIGSIFASSTVGLVAAATCGLLLLHALTNVPEAMLQREFNVRRRLIVSPIISISFAVVSVSLAAAGWGVWAMVAGQYASQIAGVVSLWVICRWRPGRGTASVRLWRELGRFGLPLVLGMLGARARAAVEAFVVGRGLSASSLGQFRYGQRIARISSAGIIEVGAYSLFPAFSRIASDSDRLRAAYLQALRWTMVAAVAMTGIMIALGEGAVVVMFGERWRPGGVALVAMSGMGIGYAMGSASEEAIKACGQTRLLNWLTGADLVLGVGLLVGLVAWKGLVGAALSLSLTSIIAGMVVLLLARRVIDVPLRTVASALASPLPALAVATVATWMLEHRVVHADSRPLLPALACLAAETALFVVIYLSTLCLVDRHVLRTLTGAVRKIWRLRSPGGTA